MTNGGGHPPQDPKQSASPTDKPQPSENKEPVRK